MKIKIEIRPTNTQKILYETDVVIDGKDIADAVDPKQSIMATVMKLLEGSLLTIEARSDLK